MKFFFKAMLIFSLISSSCKKEIINISVPDYKYTGYPGDITGLLLNGQPWTIPSDWHTQTFGLVHLPDTSCNILFGSVRVKSFTNNKEDRESIGIGSIPMKEGKFIFPAAADITLPTCSPVIITAIFLHEADGDAIAGIYTRLPNVESSVTISSYDTISGDVRGTFDITFFKHYKTPGYYDNYPDTVRFNGGTFHTKWIK